MKDISCLKTICRLFKIDMQTEMFSNMMYEMAMKMDNMR